MRKQVMLYWKTEALSCKPCKNCEIIINKESEREAIICHINYFKPKDIPCPEFINSDIYFNKLLREK